MKIDHLLLGLKANGFFYVYNNYTYGRNITSTDNSIRYPTLSADETTGQINDLI